MPRNILFQSILPFVFRIGCISLLLWAGLFGLILLAGLLLELMTGNSCVTKITDYGNASVIIALAAGYLTGIVCEIKKYIKP